MKKRYLFCVLIPIGLISLVLGVMGVVSFFKAGVIYEVACDRSEGTMLIPAKGTYSIWLSGPNNSVNSIAPSKPRLVLSCQHICYTLRSIPIQLRLGS